MGDFANEALQLIYQAKYLALKRRCEEVQQANEKLVNRIYNVKKIIKRYKRERSVLMQRLDGHGDNYQEALVPAFWEEGAGDEEADQEETNLAVASIPGLKQEPVDGQADNATGIMASPGGVIQSGAESMKKTKRGKSGADRRPANAYMIFCTMQRKAVQQKYLELHGEEASRSELTKVLSHEWKQLSLEEKQVYISMAEEKKKQHIATKAEPSNEDASSLAISSHGNQGVVMDMSDFVKVEVKMEQD